MSILDAKDLAEKYKQAYEEKVDDTQREAKEIITTLGGEDPLNILKSATGLGMDPKQYERRSRGEVQRGMEPREFISGGFKLKDMTGFDTFEEQKELVLERIDLEKENLFTLDVK